MTDHSLTPVLAAPMIDPAQGRIELELPAGLSIAQIVEMALPDKTLDRNALRVALATDQGVTVIDAKDWRRIKPRPGVRVIIRAVPGKTLLRSILQIIVAIAAIALAYFFAPALAGALGISTGLAQGIIGIGVSVLGNLLINALIPPAKPEETHTRYVINGWRNRLDADGAIPLVLGKTRYAPPFGALSYSEIVGDNLYIRTLFCFGYGQLALDDFRIGKTSLAEYDEVDIQVRDGLAEDDPITLMPTQRAEESVGAELTRPWPRNDAGDIVAGASIETPVTRATGADASGASVILAWPSGLFTVDDDGDVRSTTVSVRIDQRLVTADEWQTVTTLVISAKTREGMYRQHTWAFPSRGRWQVRCVMMTDETTSTQVNNRTSWAALQTIRPEYPLAVSDPLALVGLRIKATHQLNGTLDNFSAVASRVCPDWDHTTSTWITRATSNPASLYRYALQSPANPRPVSDAGLDLSALADWHDFCRLSGLKYDRVLDDASTTLRDALVEIAGAGRASPRHDGLRWTVVIDRPADLPVIDDLSPRTCSDWRVTRSYISPPDGFRVKFNDASNDYEPAERLVPWPGHTGDIVLTEALDLPGKTDPAEVYLAARRRMYETIHRPDVYRASRDGALGVATRGDLVMASVDLIERTQVAGRVTRAEGHLVELDEVVTMEPGQSYALRYRLISADDTVGASVVRSVVTVPGATHTLIFKGAGELPTVGDIAFFGVSGSECYRLIVTDVEAGKDFSAHYTMIAAAPEIDALLAAEVVPPWSGRVGAPLDPSDLQPPAPRFKSITSGVSQTDVSGLISYLIEPGSGPVVTAQYEINHRLSGATSWSTLTISSAAGGGTIIGYATGNVVEMRASAISPDGVRGPATAIVTFTVGSHDAAIPGALDTASIGVTALLGGASIAFATPDDAAITQVQVYRSTSSTLNRTTDAVGSPMAVQPSRTYTTALGDTTRQNLIANGGMDSATVWGLGTGWAIASGLATKTTGTSASLTQALATLAGKFYRISLSLSGVSSGSLTPRLTGGSTRSGTARSTNGSFLDRIQAVSGNTTFDLFASSTFAGSVDNVSVYLETSTCLAQGTHYIWLEPQNVDGVPGPATGPFAVTIK